MASPRDIEGILTLVAHLAGAGERAPVELPAELLRRHGLAPLAHLAGVAGVRDDFVRASLAWARIARDLPPVVDALVAAGVPVAPIKGVAYATDLYPTPAARPMTDVDLLVPPTRYRDATGRLAALGFTRVPGPPLHHASTWTRAGLVIDLHHTILTPLRGRLDLDAIWARSAPAAWPDGAARLDDADQLLFHLIHVARNHLGSPLIHVVDAARLLVRLPDGDPAPVLALAARYRVRAAVARALQFCRALAAGPACPPRPAGWPGPTLDEVVALRRIGVAQRIAFDTITAGSAPQLVGRIVAYAADRAARLSAATRAGARRRRAAR